MISTASRHAQVLRLAAAAARPQPSLPRCPQASAALEHAPGLKSTHPLKVADEVGMALSGARDLVVALGDIAPGGCRAWYGCYWPR